MTATHGDARGGTPPRDAARTPGVPEPALTPAGLRAKAELVRLLHGADLIAVAGHIEQRALAPLCDDLIAPQD